MPLICKGCFRMFKSRFKFRTLTEEYVQRVETVSVQDQFNVCTDIGNFFPVAEGTLRKGYFRLLLFDYLDDWISLYTWYRSLKGILSTGNFPLITFDSEGSLRKGLLGCSS